MTVKFSRTALAVLLLCADRGPVTFAQLPLTNPVESARAELARDPNNPTLLYVLAARLLAAGDRTASIAALETLVDTGDGFLPPRDLGFAELNGDPAYEAVRRRLEAKLPSADIDAKRAFVLDDQKLVPEGIAYDQSSQRAFIGSTYRGTITVVKHGRRINQIAVSPGQSVMGLAVEPRRNLLIAVVSQLAQEKHKDSVVLFDLKSLRVLRRGSLPDAELLNDVAVDREGHLYITDSTGGRVWRVNADTLSVSPVTAAGVLRGANGIAVDLQSQQLYVATSRGVMTSSLRDPTTSDLSFSLLGLPPKQSLASIDGLYVVGEALVGIQNSTNPGRVVKAVLAPDGLSVTSVETLLSHHHVDIVEPTTAAVAEDALLVLATTNVTAMNADRSFKSSVALRKPVVLRVSLGRGK